MESRWNLFRNRSFAWYWIGYFLSQMGDWIFSIAVSWMILELTGSGLVMGTFMMFLGIPRLVFMLIGGVAVDRFEPRKVMFISDISRALVLAVLLLLSIGQTPELGILYGTAVLFGIVDAFYWPAAGALRQRIVEKEQYTQSNSVLVGTMQVSTIVGPILGATLVSWVGSWSGIAVNVIVLVVSAVTVFFIKLRPLDRPAENTNSKRSLRSDLLEGMRYVWKSPIILTMIIVSFFANAGANGVFVGLAFLAQGFGVGAEGLGHMTSGWGVGGVLGAVALSLLMIRNPMPWMTLLFFFIQGGAIFLISFSQSHWQVTGLLAVCGLASSAIQIFSSSVNQTIIPTELMGRVLSIMSLVSMGSTPFCQALAGWLIDSSGVHSIYTYGGALELLVAGCAFFIPAIRYYGKGQKKGQSVGL